MPDHLVEEIERIVGDRARVRSAGIDRAREMALAGGEYGVSVYADVAFVDPAVPYGRIHEHQCAYVDRA